MPKQSKSLLLPYYVNPTATIATLVADLQACNAALRLIPSEPQHEQYLRKKSLLKSSLFSARIEGNKLTLDDIKPLDFSENIHSATKSRAKIEVTNLSGAYEWVFSQNSSAPLTASKIKLLHSKAMKNIDPDAGLFRCEESAIFNEAGAAVYLTPSPQKIKPMLEEFLRFIKENTQTTSVTACMAHIIFEKIHPFLDGNGRVERLVFAYLLHQADLQMRGMLSVEEVLDTKKSQYYDVLSKNTANLTPAVEYLLECLVEAARMSLEQLKQATSNSTTPALNLLPRRQEILQVIEDHKLVSFDFLVRRFMTIKPSTLHYDLKCLIDQGYIFKVGQTRGAQYSVTKR